MPPATEPAPGYAMSRTDMVELWLEDLKLWEELMKSGKLTKRAEAVPDTDSVETVKIGGKAERDIGDHDNVGEERLTADQELDDEEREGKDEEDEEIRPFSAMDLYWQGYLEESCQHFESLVSFFVGEEYRVPLFPEFGVRSQLYMSMSHIEQAYLMWCYHGIAQCLYRGDMIIAALIWLEEARIVALNARFALANAPRDWELYNPDVRQFTLEHIKIQSLAADIFLPLGNTATATQRRWTTKTAVYDVMKHHDNPTMTLTMEFPQLIEMIKLRHPSNIKPLVRLDLEYPELCVSGSWQKLRIRKAGGPDRRMEFASFIWNGHLYVAGGRMGGTHGVISRDLHSLDLTTRESWVTLPKYPVNVAATGDFVGWHMIPDPVRAKAYLFTGRPTLDFFDLNTKKWDCIPTRFKPDNPDDEAAGIKDWPYPKNDLKYSTQQLVDGKLYVFGGIHGATGDGCNLFMVLDLTTRQWKRLGGTVYPSTKGDHSCPGPRRSASSWVDKDGDRIYLLFGECDRLASPKSKDRVLLNGYPYDDMWSYSITTGKWLREKMDGNIPCARTEAAIQRWKRRSFFGGYNAVVPTDFIPENSHLAFSYYADTFVYDSTTCPEETRRVSWRQVITHGFPSYRSQAQLMVDPATGKVYLYGGKITNDYNSSRKVSRSFGDLWQLQFSSPRSHSESDGADLDEQAQNQPEPPRRCFTCGCVGSWKKCGGSCGGKAYFCDSDCLKEGWKEHKGMHKCKA